MNHYTIFNSILNHMINHSSSANCNNKYYIRYKISMMNRLIIVLTLFSLSATSLSCAQAKTSQKEKFQAYFDEVKALVESKSYKFVGEVVYNNKNRFVLDDTTKSEVTLNGDVVSSVVYRLDKLKGVEVSGEVVNYKATINDEKQTIAIELSINKNTFYIDIKPNGNTFLTVKYGVNNITQVGKIQSI